MLAILSILIISGCDDSNNKPINEFVGTWQLACNESISGTYTFLSDSYSGDYSVFSNPDCTGDVVRDETFEASITYGDKVIVASGVEATEVDIFFDIDGYEIHVLELFYSDGNRLYSGGEEEYDEASEAYLRPSDINFDFYLTRQTEIF